MSKFKSFKGGNFVRLNVVRVLDFDQILPTSVYQTTFNPYANHAERQICYIQIHKNFKILTTKMHAKIKNKRKNQKKNKLQGNYSLVCQLRFHFKNEPRLAFRSTSVTSGRPRRLCQADFKKLISPFVISIKSSLSDAM